MSRIEDLFGSSFKDSLPEVKNNLSLNSGSPINAPLSMEDERSFAVDKSLSELKSQVSKEIGLDEKLKAVNGDSGLLTPNDFGHLGGQMSGRLTAHGKELYRRMTNEQ